MSSVDERVERVRRAVAALLDAPAGSTRHGDPSERQLGEAYRAPGAEEPESGPAEGVGPDELRAAIDRLVAAALTDAGTLDAGELARLREELQRLADGALVRFGQDDEE